MSKRVIVIATIKSWNLRFAKELQEGFSGKGFDIHIISDPVKLTLDLLNNLKPEYIFFPHWSWIISKDIFEQFACIVFHMTDLPFGRGGSPLQNLIVRGIYQTKISAIKVVKDLDAGPVYLKEDFCIEHGNANEILEALGKIIFNKMIPRMLATDLAPYEQEGQPTIFKRRLLAESEMYPENFHSLTSVYDFIRMLDGEGYPPAFLRFNGMRFVFHGAKQSDGKISAQVEIINDNQAN